MKRSKKMKKAQSSNSTPKVKYALAEKYDKEKKDQNKKEVDAYERLKAKESDKLPRPTGWRMLILPFKMADKTKGGLHLVQETLERQQVGSTCGLVLAQGPDCYNDKTRYPEGPWCKTGDWVIFARYAGSRIQIDGGEVRLLNDDEVLATIDNPEDILHQY
tara:strand:- start:432 stop:914 length:483 start_codon:yes stop_codon:yes gene_type:complete